MYLRLTCSLTGWNPNEELREAVDLDEAGDELDDLQQNADATRHQLQLNRDQLKLNRQGQLTERFTRAVGQLGSDHLDVRLGGIYGLERIARDSDSDRATIAEVLTAYVGSHSPWPPSRPGQYVADASIHKVP